MATTTEGLPTSWWFLAERLQAARERGSVARWARVYLLNQSAGWLDALEALVWFVALCALRFRLSGAYHPRCRNYRSLVKRWTRTVAKPGRERKLAENVWYALWHSTSFALGLYTLWMEAGTSDTPGWTRQLWRTRDVLWFWAPAPRETLDGDRGWPLVLLRASMRRYYLVEIAFWLSCATYLAFERRRDDFHAMLVHHVVTSALVLCSYACCYWRIGAVILVTHDSADILLYCAKALHYTTVWPFLVDACFSAFVVVFFLSRLIFFPMFCVRPVLSDPFAQWTKGAISRSEAPGGIILPVFLSVLQILHIFWFGLILRMIVRTLRGTRVSRDGDIRSDDELSDYYEGDEKKKE